MAKICILMTVTPEAWADRRQFYRQAPALADDGHEVIYMASVSEDNIADHFKFSILSEHTRRTVRVTGGLNLFRRIVKIRPAAVQLCSVEQLPLGLTIKAFTGIKVIYDCREDMYHSMLQGRPQLQAWQRYILASCTRLIEYLAARTFDGIITSDPAIYDIHRAMPADRKMIFYNTALVSRFTRNYLPLAQREYDIVLLGGMHRRSGIMVLLEILQILTKQGKKVRTLLIGEPAALDRIVIDRTVRKLGLEDDLDITGIVPHAEVPVLLPKAQIGLVLLLDRPKFRHNIACKAFEYMACGMPVVSSDLPPERLFIREGETGLFFNPGDCRPQGHR